MAAAGLAQTARIFIDGDACPVKDETLKVAARHGMPVVIVSNGGLRPSRDPNVTHVVVRKTADAADDWIAEAVLTGEIVVTADIALAARTLAKGAHALAPNGRPFTPDFDRHGARHARSQAASARNRGHQGTQPRVHAAGPLAILGELDRMARRAASPR